MRVIKKMKGIPKSAVIMVKTEKVEPVEKVETTLDETANHMPYTEEMIDDFYITNNLLELIDELLTYDHITDPIERVDPELVNIYAKIGRYIRQIFNNLHNDDHNAKKRNKQDELVDADNIKNEAEHLCDIINVVNLYGKLKNIYRSSESTEDLLNIANFI